MARLIDADALIERLTELSEGLDGAFGGGYKCACLLVKRTPTIEQEQWKEFLSPSDLRMYLEKNYDDIITHYNREANCVVYQIPNNKTMGRFDFNTKKGYARVKE